MHTINIFVLLIAGITGRSLAVPISASSEFDKRDNYDGLHDFNFGDSVMGGALAGSQPAVQPHQWLDSAVHHLFKSPRGFEGSESASSSSFHTHSARDPTRLILKRDNNDDDLNDYYFGTGPVVGSVAKPSPPVQPHQWLDTVHHLGQSPRGFEDTEPASGLSFHTHSARDQFSKRDNNGPGDDLHNFYFGTGPVVGFLGSSKSKLSPIV